MVVSYNYRKAHGTTMDVLRCWARYRKQAFAISSELEIELKGDKRKKSWFADFIMANDKDIIEVEVKKTKSDFRSDLRRKREKHENLTHVTRFYFCCSQDAEEGLGEYMIDVLKKDYPKYGVMLVGVPTSRGHLYDEADRVHIIRRGLELGEYSRDIAERIKDTMSSEIAHISLNNIREKLRAKRLN